MNPTSGDFRVPQAANLSWCRTQWLGSPYSSPPSPWRLISTWRLSSNLPVARHLGSARLSFRLRVGGFQLNLPTAGRVV